MHTFKITLLQVMKNTNINIAKLGQIKEYFNQVNPITIVNQKYKLRITCFEDPFRFERNIWQDPVLMLTKRTLNVSPCPRITSPIE